jgi:hypothetical protein
VAIVPTFLVALLGAVGGSGPELARKLKAVLLRPGPMGIPWWHWMGVLPALLAHHTIAAEAAIHAMG